MSDVDPDLEAFMEDDEDEPQAAQQGDVNARLNALSAELRKTKKSLKSITEERDAVLPYREKYLTSQAPEVLKQVGIDPSLSKLVVRDLGNGDLSQETVTAWATENGIEIKTPEPEPQQTSAAGGTFAPTVGGDAPTPQKLTTAEAEARVRDGLWSPGQFAQAFNEGLIELNNPDAQQQQKGF